MEKRSAAPDHRLAVSVPAGVIIAATPLGNALDASPRLKAALAQASVVAAEDTRRTRHLAEALGVDIAGKVVSNFDHNEQERVQWLLAEAGRGTVVVVTDAGMPSVSDPGYALVSAAHDAGIPVTCFPGPSAVPTAIAVSGLRVGKFIFDGFCPRKQGQKESWLKELRTQERAVCFFESPHRLAATLATAAEVLGEHRRAAVCRELSKTFEEVRRGGLGELAQWAAEGVRGEITVVIEGADGSLREGVEVADVAREAAARAAAGERLKDVCRELAAVHGVSSKEIYNAAVAAR